MFEKEPIVTLVEDAKAEFLANYGFPAETLHVSPMMEAALHRWAGKHMAYSQNLNERMQGAVFAGLPVVKMTRNSALVEFWLSTVRMGQRYTANVVIEPEAVGVRRAVNDNGIVLGGGEDSDYDEVE